MSTCRSMSGANWRPLISMPSGAGTWAAKTLCVGRTWLRMTLPRRGLIFCLKTTTQTSIRSGRGISPPLRKNFGASAARCGITMRRNCGLLWPRARTKCDWAQRTCSSADAEGMTMTTTTPDLQAVMLERIPFLLIFVTSRMIAELQATPLPFLSTGFLLLWPNVTMHMIGREPARLMRCARQFRSV